MGMSHWRVPFFNDLKTARASALTEESGLLQNESGFLRNFLERKFREYDRDGNNSMDTFECSALFRDFGEPVERFPELMKMMDHNNDGVVDFEEFYTAMQSYLGDSVKEARSPQKANQSINDSADDNDEDADDEDDEMPADIAALKSPQQQQRAIMLRSAWMMSLGTIIVLLVSDPAVDVLSSIGARVGIPAFYVSFFLAPFASNASELIAAYNYARKKTRESITISLSTLEGAGIMNNTFVTAIFFLVIYLNDSIAWSFSTETLAILIVELIIMFISQKQVISLFDGLIVVAMYPLSLVFIALLENYTDLK